jgi:hypothetical protein
VGGCLSAAVRGVSLTFFIIIITIIIIRPSLIARLCYPRRLANHDLCGCFCSTNSGSRNSKSISRDSRRLLLALLGRATFSLGDPRSSLTIEAAGNQIDRYLQTTGFPSAEMMASFELQKYLCLWGKPAIVFRRSLFSLTRPALASQNLYIYISIRITRVAPLAAG